MASDAALVQALPRLSVRSTMRWAWTGACAVLDQGLFAVSNFVVNVALARWLTPHEYGAFTTAYAVFLIVATVHTGLIAEPLIIYGAQKYRDVLPAYVTFLLRGHWVLTSLLGLLLLATGGVLAAFGQTALAGAFVALAIATPFILLQWLMRRTSYIRVGPHLAVSAGLLYMASLAAGAYALFRVGWMSAPAALLLMGGGSAASALWIRNALGLVRKSNELPQRDAIIADHWAYGRWAIGTGVLGALMLNMYYIVMPVAHGLEQSAALRALSNFALPGMQTFYALAVPTVPALVRIRRSPDFKRVMHRLIWLYGAGAFVYWLSIGLGHAQIVRLLYGDKYNAESSLLWLLALLPFTSAGVSVFESGLRALEHSRDICRAYVLAVVASVLLGVPAVVLWGTTGAAVGLLISYAVAVASLISSLRLRMRQDHA